MQAPNDGDDFGLGVGRYDALRDTNVTRTCEAIAPRREPLHVVTQKYDAMRVALNVNAKQ